MTSLDRDIGYDAGEPPASRPAPAPDWYQISLRVLYSTQTIQDIRRIHRNDVDEGEILMHLRSEGVHRCFGCGIWVMLEDLSSAGLCDDCRM